jgi:hypothetical protein
LLDRDEPRQDVRRPLFFADGGVIHNLASPCCPGPLRSAMNNSGNDISLCYFGAERRTVNAERQTLNVKR